MRCLSCNKMLTDYEATRKSANTGEYIDMCNKCFHTIEEDIEVNVRADLESNEDEAEDEE